ncbi:CCG-binding protein 1 [Macadamia integrifolia]|uniref:CCG-binding protein 1 n=1 Tax=Macadamia integrifolia TaxID=60698 RepID=UPI001C4F6413|nr:CCG-binding protein 1 [Macadamia integrifolia]
MIRSTLLHHHSSSATAFFVASDLNRSSVSCPRVATTVCSSSSSRSNSDTPKLEPFSRSKIDRGLKEPSFLQKCENELADYCSTLEGDASYSCWRAYFELKKLETEYPKEEVEKIVLQSEGVKSLIDCMHGVSAIRKKKEINEDMESRRQSNLTKQKETSCPVPDGLPKSKEELEEEERAKMPDSLYTRLLRTKGRFPAWYSPVPDHETD